MNGVLVVDKPLGPTSHDVVARVRRALKLSRIGHTGTLDPLATGVLPLVVGRATRLARFFSAAGKEYIADVRLGFVSDTYDAQGSVTLSAASAVELVGPLPDALLDEFRGTYWQMPPPFSAKKISGTPAYRLARRNEPVELKPVNVTVSSLDVLDQGGDSIRLRVVCSSGFYVRTLAHDLGARLGCGAYLTALRRTRVGSFTLEEAAPLAAIEAEGPDAAARLIPLDRLLPDLPAAVLNEPGVRRVGHGNAVTPEHLVSPGPAQEGGTLVRLVDEGGALLGIGQWRPGALLHPVVVLV